MLNVAGVSSLVKVSQRGTNPKLCESLAFELRTVVVVARDKGVNTDKHPLCSYPISKRARNIYTVIHRSVGQDFFLRLGGE